MTLLGLEFFEDCAEHFLPITELSYSSGLDWTFPQVIPSSQLFETGDGINVYIEPAFMSGLYQKVLYDWISNINQNKSRRPLFRFLNYCSSDLINRVKICRKQVMGKLQMIFFLCFGNSEFQNCIYLKFEIVQIYS